MENRIIIERAGPKTSRIISSHITRWFATAIACYCCWRCGYFVLGYRAHIPRGIYSRSVSHYQINPFQRRGWQLRDACSKDILWEQVESLTGAGLNADLCGRIRCSHWLWPRQLAWTSLFTRPAVLLVWERMCWIVSRHLGRIIPHDTEFTWPRVALDGNTTVVELSCLSPHGCTRAKRLTHGTVYTSSSPAPVVCCRQCQHLHQTDQQHQQQ